MIRRTESPLLSKDKPSLSTIRNNFYTFLEVMGFSFGNEFRQMLSSLTLKTNEIFGQAVQDGDLMKGRCLQRQQLTFRSIRRMLVKDFNLFIQRYDGRAAAWYHVKNLMMIHLAVLLQSALHARAGDIARSQGYVGEQYMKWEDIEVRFQAKSTTASVLNLEGRFSIRYEKGKK